MDKRTLILQTTRSLLNNHDYTQITISQIAKACGIGKGTVYEYFQSKEDLFIQVIVAYAEEQNQVLCQPLGAASLSQAIQDIALRLYDMFTDNSAMPSLFLGVLQQQSMPSAYTALRFFYQLYAHTLPKCRHKRRAALPAG